jgi:epsilon-lactone hydrolase
MASWQAHAANLFLRATVKRRLKNNTDLANVRAALNGTMPPPKNVQIYADIVGGVPGEWVRGEASPENAPTLLYLHGGGYFACSPRTHRPITAFFAHAGFAVYVPDYRLAPEHPFPAALDDALAAWQALRNGGRAAKHMAVAGDSAGGGLSLALLLKLRDMGQALPAAAALFSPWTDLAATGASVQENADKDAMFWAPGIPAGAAYYIGTDDARNPLISPLYGDMHGLPPLLIHCGQREILRDDGTRFAAKAQAAGVTVSLRVWDVVPHVWQIAHRVVPEGRESLREAAAFIKAEIE